MNVFFTYAIYNKIRNKIYIGHTNNLKERIKRHNDLLPSKSTAYTRKNSGFWKLIYSEKSKTRKDAVQREKELKSSRGRKFIRNIIETKPD